MKTAGPSRVDAGTLPDKMEDEDGVPSALSGLGGERTDSDGGGKMERWCAGVHMAHHKGLSVGHEGGVWKVESARCWITRAAKKKEGHQTAAWYGCA